MTIKQKLNLSFSLILLIIVFIIAVFFYSIFNLNEIHQKHIQIYDQIRNVKKLKEYNNNFAWIVHDITNDYKNVNVRHGCLKKANELYAILEQQQKDMLQYALTQKEQSSINKIFENFKIIEKLLTDDVNYIPVMEANEFQEFNQKFEKTTKCLDSLLAQYINYLQTNLNYSETQKSSFIDTIKIELIALLLLAFILSFLISFKLINQIQQKLSKLNYGVLQLFNNNENTIKVDIGSNNELSEITHNLNLYLEKQKDIIHSREELLRNISHELKTPITKGKFLLEKLPKDQDATITQSISNVFVDIETLTSKLLEREKLNFATLQKSQFKVSTLILESLSKLSIENESEVTIDIIDDFEIIADKYYLTIALKNLIDNALKYAIEIPIIIEAKDNVIFIKNKSTKLTNDLIYYIQPFTREPNQQLGHGLGLNIVNKIVELHDFELQYQYQNSQNIFSIITH